MGVTTKPQMPHILVTGPFRIKETPKQTEGSFQGALATVVIATELNNPGNAVPFKAQSICFGIVRPDSVRPVVVEATMHGIKLSQITNDYTALLKTKKLPTKVFLLF